MNRPIASDLREIARKERLFRGLDQVCVRDSARGTSETPIAGGDSCNAVRVGASREDAPHSGSTASAPLGAPPAGYADLGAISPELALVDPVLAGRAGMLLPEPQERPRHSRRTAEAPRPSVSPPRRPEVAPPPVARGRSRWRRTVALAVRIFTAGAASGGLLGRRQEASPRTQLQAQANLSTVPIATNGEHSAAETKSDAKSKASRPLRSGHRSSTSATAREKRRVAPATWAANVLGVTVGIDGRGVRLVWVRPTESNHVVVVRKLVSDQRSVVLLRGQATSFRDVSACGCTAYRYIIINYDGRGHPSTGVPTSVVTQGCGRKAAPGSCARGTISPGVRMRRDRSRRRDDLGMPSRSGRRRSRPAPCRRRGM
jgi:hypothetical protein